MTHLDIIKDAYDKCGIEYVVRTQKSEQKETQVWSYLFFCNSRTREAYEKDPLYILKMGNFMEFLNGEVASY